jgi:hypothetical protein
VPTANAVCKLARSFSQEASETLVEMMRNALSRLRAVFHSVRAVAAAHYMRRPASSNLKTREESNQLALSMRISFFKDQRELIASCNCGNAQFFRCSLGTEAFRDDRG